MLRLTLEINKRYLFVCSVSKSTYFFCHIKDIQRNLDFSIFYVVMRLTSFMYLNVETRHICMINITVYSLV